VTAAEAIAGLPHAAGARMIDGVVDTADDRIRCSARVPEGSAWTVGSDVPSWVAIEIAAQAAAVLERLAAPDGAPAAARGFVVRVREVRCVRPRFAASARVVVDVRRAGAAPPLALYRFEAEADGAAIASGTVGTWVEAPGPVEPPR